MTTGSLCLTEILMSRKPCSSNREHSQSADSTSASGVALPYLASSRLSSEPAFTPMRIGTPASVAALAISATLSSKALMLPGLTRTAAQPASMAANTYFGWKWMSAMTGMADFFAIAGSASASSWLGTATRTIWQPAAVSSAICCSVLLTSAVSVVVIDWTETGASPPTGTSPTMICRLVRRFASGLGGVVGIPRPMAVTAGSYLTEVDRVHDVRSGQHQRQHGEDRYYSVRRKQQLVEVHALQRTPVPTHPADLVPALLVAENGQVTAVERQQRQQVEHADEEVHPGDDQQEAADPHTQRLAREAEDVPADAADADHADGAGGVPVGREDRAELVREVGQRVDRPRHQLPEYAGCLCGGGQRADGLDRVLRPDADAVDLLAVHGDRLQGGGRLVLHAVVRPGDVQRLVRRCGEGGPELIDAGHRLPVEGDDLVARQQPDARGRTGRAVRAGGIRISADALLDGRDLHLVVVGLSADPQREEQQHHGDDHVHRGAGDKDDRPLARRLPIEGAWLVLGFDRLQVGHPDDLHVAAGRDGLEAVLGLALLPGPQRRAETHEELGRLHPELLREREVTGLVQHHRDQQRDHERHDAYGRHAFSRYAWGLAPWSISRRAAARAASSTSNTSAGEESSRSGRSV